MKKVLTNNLGLKLLSVISAIMLWLIVVNIDDPVISQDFTGIRVTMLNEDAVISQDKVYRIENDSDIISVRVSAKRSVLSKLTSEDFTATADLQKNIKLGNLVGIDVTCSNRNIKTTDITKSRENVVISIEDAASEQFNVVVTQSGTEGSGYVVGTAVPEKSLIEISGPASVVARIRRVVAEINVTGFTFDRTQKCQLKVLDSEDVPVDTTYLEYYGKTDGMNVNVTMLKTKTVKLKVGYTGTPHADYTFNGIFYKPETVEIAGDIEDIAGISEIVIPDEAVNIDGITENLQLDLDITDYLPAGIRLAKSADASVAVVVELEKKEGRPIKIPVSDIEFQNIPRGLEIDFDELEEIELVVMGSKEELDNLDMSEIIVTLDLDEYSKAGTYTKKLDVTLPDELRLMEDAEAEFKLMKANQTSTGNTNNNNTNNSN
ncbi:MAG: hypothetical protein HFJ10_04890 [Lachnospiraceae bacterium]|nr:hypothetical protein [Lachnospiraceae bacterium]